MKKVAVVMGSKSDREVMAGAEKVLEQFGVAYETHVMSAHRTPARVSEFVATARQNGFGVIIAAAGWAAHLAGAVAGQTTLPVIGVPLASSPLQGFDSLLSTVQMPPGIPVATVAVGCAANAAHLAVQILAVEDAALEEKLAEYRQQWYSN